MGNSNLKSHGNPPPQLGFTANKKRGNNHLAVTGPDRMHSAIQECKPDSYPECSHSTTGLNIRHIASQPKHHATLQIDYLPNLLGEKTGQLRLPETPGYPGTVV